MRKTVITLLLLLVLGVVAWPQNVYKTYVDGELISAADINASFAYPFTNTISVSSAWTFTRAGASITITPGSAPAANTVLLDINNQAGTDLLNVDYEGDVYLAGGITFEGATANAFEGLLASADVTDDRTWTLPNLTGTVTLLGAENAGHLLFADNTYDIGASGATRPRDLFLGRNATIGGTLGVTGNTTFTGDVAINGGTTIGNATGDALTFHPSAWTLTNAVTVTGTWTNLGTVTTADINGGTLDGVTIGGASAAAGTFTTVTASGSLALLNTSSDVIGVVTKGGWRFIHNYNDGTADGGNTFVGVNSGNFTMSPGGGDSGLSSYDTGMGLGSLQDLSTGYRNTGAGYASLNHLTTGHNNSGVGFQAGRYISGGAVANTTSNTSVYVGSDTKASADGNANEIAIGYNVTGAGSNTVTLGNASITSTILRGAVRAATLNLTGDASQIVLDSDEGSGYTTTITDSTAASAKVITLPNSTTTLAGLATAQTFSAAQTFSSTLTTADNQWIGLGASAGRIEFDDQATDEVNILAANVGIGSSAPAYTLQTEAVVTGRIAGFYSLLVDSVGEETLVHIGGANRGPDYGIEIGCTPEVSSPGVQDHAFIVKTNPTSGTGHLERFRITSDGTVGINETSVGAQLDVESGNAARIALLVRGANAASANLATFEDNAGTDQVTITSAGLLSAKHVYPLDDNTYYLGKNDDDTPFAWKGLILKDTTNGKYYRLEIINGVVTATDLTD